MADMVRGVLEDQRKGLLLTDFSGGIVTDTGGLSLGPNQSPDSLNVFAWEGNLHFRGGHTKRSPLPAGADADFTYYDVNNNHHKVVWAGGSMYDTTSGAAVLIAANVYTAGQTVAHTQLNGVLYWSTLTVPIRQWNGVTEGPLVSSGGTGVIPTPSCMFLIVFNGSLVAVNYVANGVAQPGAYIWSNVNDPSKFVGANTQTVGSNDGGHCVFALLMGIAQVGVTPTKQFMVGKNNRQMFLYEGALGSQIENAISSPVGILDGKSAVYIPTKQGLGAVMFLGDDAQFYLCNGIETAMVSDGIKTLAYNLVNNALQTSPTLNFNAVYNQRFQYYMCDFGNNTQLIYKWDTAAWWYFSGWPSGPYMTAPANNGMPTIYVASNYPGKTGVYELAIDQHDDDGKTISAYFTTPYMHGGKPERLKLFQDLTMFAYNVGCQYKVTAIGMPYANGVIDATVPLLFNDPAVGAIAPAPGTVALWGLSLWGRSSWSGGNTSVAQPQFIGAMHGPLVVPSVATKWARAGMPLPLRTGAAQFKIAWNAGIPDFRMTALKIAFLPQNENVGNLPFTTQGQVVTNTVERNGVKYAVPGDAFTNTGLPLPVSPVPPIAPTIPIPGPTPGTKFDLGTSLGNAQYYYSISAGLRDLLAISPDGAYLYLGVAVNSFNDSAVVKMDAFTGAVLSTSPTQTGYQVQKMAVSPDGSKLYCYSRFPHEIFVYNTSDMSLAAAASINAAVSPNTVESFELNSAGTQILLAFHTGFGLVDTGSLVCTAHAIATSTGSSYACWSATGTVYCAFAGIGFGGQNIDEYATNGAHIQTFALGLTAGIGDIAPFAVDSTTGYIYGNQFIPGVQNTLFVYNPTGALVGSSAIGPSASFIVQGMTFAGTSALFTTQDDRLISLDATGNAAASSLAGFGLVSEEYSSVVAGNGVAYILGENNNAPFYDSVVCVAAIP